MKKNVLTLLAGAALLCACQPTQKGTTISGTLTGVESDTLLVNILAMPPVENSPRIADTIAMQQGKFNLELQADTLPLQVSIYAKPTGNKALDMRHSIHVVALPGDVLTVNGSMEDYSVEGSDLYAALNEAEKTWQPTIDSLQTILKKHSNIDPTDLPEDSTITAQIQALGQRAMALHIDYIRQHPDEDASVFLASQSGSRMEEALSLLGDKAKNGAFAVLYQYMDAQVKKIKARKEAEAKIKEGLPAPIYGCAGEEDKGPQGSRSQDQGRTPRPGLHPQRPQRPTPLPQLPARQIRCAGLLGQLVRLVHQGHPRHEEVL